MKKLFLKMNGLGEKMTREQMKKIGGGGPPTCNEGVACNVTLPVPPYLVAGFCLDGPSGCGCYDGVGEFSTETDCWLE